MLLLPFRVVDWAMVQAYRALGLLIVQPLRVLLSISVFISGSGALFLTMVLLVAPLLLGYVVFYSWGFVGGFVAVLFVLKQSHKLQESLKKLLAKAAAHFIGIVPPHFNAAEEAKPQAFDIPEGSEPQPPPSIEAYAHYGLASQVPDETGDAITARLSPELQAFITRG